MFWYFHQSPRPGEVYNAGGSRFSNCSILEAFDFCEKITGKKIKYVYDDNNRIGDHIWWISDVRKFQAHYPKWILKLWISDILVQIHDELTARL